MGSARPCGVPGASAVQGLLWGEHHVGWEESILSLWWRGVAAHTILGYGLLTSWTKGNYLGLHFVL